MHSGRDYRASRGARAVTGQGGGCILAATSAHHRWPWVTIGHSARQAGSGARVTKGKLWGDVMMSLYSGDEAAAD